MENRKQSISEYDHTGLLLEHVLNNVLTESSVGLDEENKIFYIELFEQVKAELQDYEEYIIAEAVAKNLGYETRYILPFIRLSGHSWLQVQLPEATIRYPIPRT